MTLFQCLYVLNAPGLEVWGDPPLLQHNEHYNLVLQQTYPSHIWVLNKFCVGHFLSCSCSLYLITPRKTLKGESLFSLISCLPLSFYSDFKKTQSPSSQQMEMEMENDLPAAPLHIKNQTIA